MAQVQNYIFPMTSLLCLLAIAPLGKIMAIFFKRLKSEYIITCIIGSALQCYVCNSRIDEGCSGMPDPKYLRNCSELSDTKKYILCRKIDQEVPPAEGREYTQIKSIDKSNNARNSKFGKQWTPGRGRSASADGKKHWPIVTKNTSTADCRMCAVAVQTDVTDHLEIVRRFLMEPASFCYL